MRDATGASGAAIFTSYGRCGPTLAPGWRLSFIASAVVAFTAWRSIWIWSHHGLPLVAVGFASGYLPDRGRVRHRRLEVVRTAAVSIVAAGLFIWRPVTVATPVLVPFNTAVTAFAIATMIAWLVGILSCAAVLTRGGGRAVTTAGHVGMVAGPESAPFL